MRPTPAGEISVTLLDGYGFALLEGTLSSSEAREVSAALLDSIEAVSAPSAPLTPAKAAQVLRRGGRA